MTPAQCCQFKGCAQATGEINTKFGHINKELSLRFKVLPMNHIHVFWFPDVELPSHYLPTYAAPIYGYGWFGQEVFQGTVKTQPIRQFNYLTNQGLSCSSKLPLLRTEL